MLVTSVVKIKANYFTSKMSLFRNVGELQFGTSKLWQTIGESKQTKGKSALLGF